MRRKTIALLLVLSVMSIIIAGCGNNEPTAESSAVLEHVYETPEGYITYTFNGYDIDCPESWTLYDEVEQSDVLVFMPNGSNNLVVMMNVIQPEEMNTYEAGVKIDEELLQKESVSLVERPDDKMAQTATDMLSDDPLTAISVCAGLKVITTGYVAYIDNSVIFRMSEVTEIQVDDDVFSDAVYSILKSIRPHE